MARSSARSVWWRQLLDSFSTFFRLARYAAVPPPTLGGDQRFHGESIIVNGVPLCFNLCVCEIKVAMFSQLRFRVFRLLCWVFVVIIEMVSPPSVLFCPHVMCLCGVLLGLSIFGLLILSD